MQGSHNTRTCYCRKAVVAGAGFLASEGASAVGEAAFGGSAGGTITTAIMSSGAGDYARSKAQDWTRTPSQRRNDGR